MIKYNDEIVFNIAKRIGNIEIDMFSEFGTHKVPMWIASGHSGLELWGIYQDLISLGVPRNDILHMRDTYPVLRVMYKYDNPFAYGKLLQTRLLADVYNQWRRLQVFKYLNDCGGITPTPYEQKYINETLQKKR